MQLLSKDRHPDTAFEWGATFEGRDTLLKWFWGRSAASPIKAASLLPQNHCISVAPHLKAVSRWRSLLKSCTSKATPTSKKGGSVAPSLKTVPERCFSLKSDSGASLIPPNQCWTGAPPSIAVLKRHISLLSSIDPPSKSLHERRSSLKSSAGALLLTQSSAKASLSTKKSVPERRSSLKSSAGAPRFHQNQCLSAPPPLKAVLECYPSLKGGSGALLLPQKQCWDVGPYSKAVLECRSSLKIERCSSLKGSAGALLLPQKQCRSAALPSKQSQSVTLD